MLAAGMLQGCEPCGSDRECRKQVTACVKRVAEQLGNTPAVCRRCYVHPRVVDAYRRGLLAAAAACDATRGPEGLSPEERALLSLLRAQESPPAKAA